MACKLLPGWVPTRLQIIWCVVVPVWPYHPASFDALTAPNMAMSEALGMARRSRFVEVQSRHAPLAVVMHMRLAIEIALVPILPAADGSVLVSSLTCAALPCV